MTNKTKELLFYLYVIITSTSIILMALIPPKNNYKEDTLKELKEINRQLKEDLQCIIKY